MTSGVNLQLRGAAVNKYGSLVVGAFGNDPSIVADLYLKVLKENEFQNVVNEVRFAILGDQNYNTFKTKLSPLTNAPVVPPLVNALMSPAVAKKAAAAKKKVRIRK